jgi:hypothetical protein
MIHVSARRQHNPPAYRVGVVLRPAHVEQGQASAVAQDSARHVGDPHYVCGMRRRDEADWASERTGQSQSSTGFGSSGQAPRASGATAESTEAGESDGS